MLNIQEQHKDLCDTAAGLLKQWYITKTGRNPEGIEFFKFDYIPKNRISGIFRWPGRHRNYCQVVLFRDKLDEPPNGLYLRETFNLAHELGHFTDYAKTGKTYNTAKSKTTFLERITGFYGEIKANFYGIRFVKNLKQKALFMGFAILGLLCLANNYFFGNIGNKFIRKIYVDWYIYGVMR